MWVNKIIAKSVFIGQWKALLTAKHSRWLSEFLKRSYVESVELETSGGRGPSSNEENFYWPQEVPIDTQAHQKYLGYFIDAQMSINEMMQAEFKYHASLKEDQELQMLEEVPTSQQAEYLMGRGVLR